MTMKLSQTTSNREQLVEETLRLVEDVYGSIRQASRATGAPPSTVYHKRAGRQSRSQTTVRGARLTPRQEGILARWITDLQLQYQPVNYTQLAKIAENFARQNDPSRPLGKNWMTRFIQRLQPLGSGRSQPLSKDRIGSAIPSQIDGWFRHFEEVVQRLGVQPQDIWNMDEIGFQMGHSQKENVVFNRTVGPR
jgi:Tc5 transposase DNA-binding domain